MNGLARIPGSRTASAAAWLLRAANLILIGVVWFVSFSAYRQLPPRIASWSSVWTGRPVTVERSLSFFLYPLCQVLFFAVLLVLARNLFIGTSRPLAEGPFRDEETARPLRTLREEVLYLALIFFNLMFIHLQTARILLSHEIGSGINRAYFLGLVAMVIFILFPYYRIRRKLVLTGKSEPPGPR